MGKRLHLGGFLKKGEEKYVYRKEVHDGQNSRKS